MEYDNTNSGVLFKNDKRPGKQDPDYTGSWEDMNGTQYWLSAWIKTSKDGTKKFMSLSARPKDRQHQQAKDYAEGAMADANSPDIPSF